jgi:hypothetical protein
MGPRCLANAQREPSRGFGDAPVWQRELATGGRDLAVRWRDLAVALR